jgi:hypothetical protein
MSRVPSVEHRVSALLAEDLLSTTGFLTPFLTIRGEPSIIFGVCVAGQMLPYRRTGGLDP